MTPQQSCEASNRKKIACVSPQPIPLPSGERGKVRGQIAVIKNVKLPFRLRRYCFHPHSRAVGYSTVFFIKLSSNRTVKCDHVFKLVIMCKTLIAEDNTTFRKLLSTILCNRFPSMIIEEAANGREVLEKVESSVPDLVFMDIGLPDANGLKLTRKIKTSHPGIVIVIFTNYDLPEYRDAALRFGATSFIAKSSWTSEQIIALVESILSDMNQ